MRAVPLTTLTSTSLEYPASLKQSGAYPAISVMGDPACLRQPILALLCSVACPGDIILQMYDLAGAQAVDPMQVGAWWPRDSAL